MVSLLHNIPLVWNGVKFELLAADGKKTYKNKIDQLIKKSSTLNI